MEYRNLQVNVDAIDNIKKAMAEVTAVILNPVVICSQEDYKFHIGKLAGLKLGLTILTEGDDFDD